MANRSKNVIGAGIGAGIIGGIVMAAYAMMHGAAVGIGFWTPMRLIAATTNGVDALIGGGGTLIWGFMIHIVTAAVWGVIFAALLPRRAGVGAGFGLGLLYGIAVWAVMTFVALALLDPTMQARISLMQGSWFINHLIFGAVTGVLVPAFRTRAAAERSSAEVRTHPERRAA